MQETNGKGETKCSYSPPEKRRCVEKFANFKCANLQCFCAVMCIYGFVEGASINGFVSIALSTLERRFQLQSSESGLIVSSADIGAVVCVLLVSHFGSKTHKPRVVAAGCLLMAFGSLLFFLPHLLVGTYDYSSGGNTTDHLCDAQRPDPCSTDKPSHSIAATYLPIFMIAQIIQGMGFSPVFTVGTAYIDDNTTPDRTAFYMGLIYALTALGVAAGFIVGGQLLNVWVDVGRTDESQVDITPSDPRWVGAWWIGFVMTAGLYVILTVPIATFPRQLNGSSDQPKSEKLNIAPASNSWKNGVVGFLKSILSLVKTPSFVLVVLVGAAETLLIQGMASFSAKLLEEKFDYDPSSAGLIIGAVTLLGGAGGMVLGGVLINRFKLQFAGMIRLCVIMAFLSLLLGVSFFINCPEDGIAGLTIDLPISNRTRLTAACNTGCQCNIREFQPVCGMDDLTYISPCHAGCVAVSPLNDKTFTNCSCVEASFVAILPSQALHESMYQATTGGCTSTCDLVWLFIPLLFLALLATFTTVTPLSMAILRCVPDEQKSLGLGIQWVSLRLLGTIPGPVLLGVILDSSCLLWQETCDGEGLCWVYDREQMSWSLFVWWAAVKVFVGLTLVGVLRLEKLKEMKTVPVNSVVTEICHVESKT